MKLKSLHIEDYKLFKDFDIDFLDKDGEALPIIVLAGVNGSGKTTILESLSEEYIAGQEKIIIENLYDNDQKVDVYLNIDYTDTSEEYHKIKLQEEASKYGGSSSLPTSMYLDNIIFSPVGKDNINDIKETIRQKYIDRAFEIDKPSEALKELQNYIAKIFDGLDLTFNLSSIDYNKNIVLFKNNNGVEFDIEALSTGEKTLLSKVLYLYFKDYKEKVILIDEPELSLHPSWQNRVLKIYENFAKISDCQIIIATHSPHIIGSAKNEYLRILKKNDDGKVEVIKDLKAEGRDINSILFDVMGEVAYRPREFDDKIDRLHIAIDDKKFDEANQRLEELKLSYGENDAVVMEAQMLIDMFSQED